MNKFLLSAFLILAFCAYYGSSEDSQSLLKPLADLTGAEIEQRATEEQRLRPDAHSGNNDPDGGRTSKSGATKPDSQSLLKPVADLTGAGIEQRAPKQERLTSVTFSDAHSGNKVQLRSNAEKNDPDGGRTSKSGATKPGARKRRNKKLNSNLERTHSKRSGALRSAPSGLQPRHQGVIAIPLFPIILLDTLTKEGPCEAMRMIISVFKFIWNAYMNKKQ